MHQEPTVVNQIIKEMRASAMMQKSQALARLKYPEENKQDMDTVNGTLQDKCTTSSSSGESKLLLWVEYLSHMIPTTYGSRSLHDSLQITV